MLKSDVLLTHPPRSPPYADYCSVLSHLTSSFAPAAKATRGLSFESKHTVCHFGALALVADAVILLGRVLELIWSYVCTFTFFVCYLVPIKLDYTT